MSRVLNKKKKKEIRFRKKILTFDNRMSILHFFENRLLCSLSHSALVIEKKIN